MVITQEVECTLVLMDLGLPQKVVAACPVKGIADRTAIMLAQAWQVLMVVLHQVLPVVACQVVTEFRAANSAVPRRVLVVAVCLVQERWDRTVVKARADEAVEQLYGWSMLKARHTQCLCESLQVI